MGNEFQIVAGPCSGCRQETKARCTLCLTRLCKKCEPQVDFASCVMCNRFVGLCRSQSCKALESTTIQDLAKHHRLMAYIVGLEAHRDHFRYVTVCASCSNDYTRANCDHRVWHKDASKSVCEFCKQTYCWTCLTRVKCQDCDCAVEVCPNCVVARTCIVTSPTIPSQTIDTKHIDVSLNHTRSKPIDETSGLGSRSDHKGVRRILSTAVVRRAADGVWIHEKQLDFRVDPRPPSDTIRVQCSDCVHVQCNGCGRLLSKREQKMCPDCRQLHCEKCRIHMEPTCKRCALADKGISIRQCACGKFTIRTSGYLSACDVCLSRIHVQRVDCSSCERSRTRCCAHTDYQGQVCTNCKCCNCKGLVNGCIGGLGGEACRLGGRICDGCFVGDRAAFVCKLRDGQSPDVLRCVWYPQGPYCQSCRNNQIQSRIASSIPDVPFPLILLIESYMFIDV